MKRVEIMSAGDDGEFHKQLECIWDGDVMKIEGEADWLRKKLEEEGIEDYEAGDGSRLFPVDGERFLDQLESNFRTVYLLASSIKEDE